MTAAFNRELGLKINREVWNGRQLDKIAEYFAEDFVADYSPAFVWRGQQHVREAVERAHATFAGFREEIKTIVADDDHVVLHRFACHRGNSGGGCARCAQSGQL